MKGLYCALAAAFALAAAGTVFWLPGRLRSVLRGEAPKVAVIIDGSGVSLERTLRALKRARSSAELDLKIIIADKAMSRENRRIAEIASKEDADIVICAPGEAFKMAERHLWRQTKMCQSNTSSLREE